MSMGNGLFFLSTVDARERDADEVVLARVRMFDLRVVRKGVPGFMLMYSSIRKLIGKRLGTVKG